MCGSGPDKTKYNIFSHCSFCCIVNDVFPSLKAIARAAAACTAHTVKETKSKKVKATVFWIFDCDREIKTVQNCWPKFITILTITNRATFDNSCIIFKCQKPSESDSYKLFLGMWLKTLNISQARRTACKHLSVLNVANLSYCAKQQGQHHSKSLKSCLCSSSLSYMYHTS